MKRSLSCGSVLHGVSLFAVLILASLSAGGPAQDTAAPTAASPLPAAQTAPAPQQAPAPQTSPAPQEASRALGVVRVQPAEGAPIELYHASYALVIGNGAYTNGPDTLPGAVSDAHEVAAVLTRKGFSVALRTDVTKETFDRAFAEFVRGPGADPDARLLFYYAGHGHTEKLSTDEDLGYLVMVDSPLYQTDPTDFGLKNVDMQWLVTQAKMIRARHALFLFDSCFSGTILNLRASIVPQAVSENVRHRVVEFITAGQANEPVPDQSVFKQAFLDLIEGRDKEPVPDGYVTGEELGLYLKSKVPEYNPTQHPQFGKIRDPKLDKGDFVFELAKAPLSVATRTPAETRTPGSTPGVGTTPDTSGIDRIIIAEKKRQQSLADEKASLAKAKDYYIYLENWEKTPATTAEEAKARLDAWDSYLKTFQPTNYQIAEAQQRRNRYRTWLPPAATSVQPPPTPTPAGPGPGADFTEDLGEGVALEMVWIPGGSFTIGSSTSETERYEDEGPQTRIQVEGFWMGKYEATQEQYERLVGANPGKFRAARNPVEQVSSNDAVAFCDSLARQTGKDFALPTEAQREYACRAGTSAPFSFGETISTDQANYDGSSAYGNGNKGPCRQKTVEVGSFAPNAFGLCDMHGNVWEWCLSLYRPYPYDEGDGRNKRPIEDLRVLRGGSWSGAPKECRSAYRVGENPTYKREDGGFRVVCVPRTR